MTTESMLIELTGSMSNLKRDFDEHKGDDKKNFKYSHHMLEDLVSKHSDDRLKDIRDEITVRENLANIGARLQFIERLIWFVLLGVLGIAGAHLSKVVF